ncbi:MAG: DUF6464 family protein [Pseudanabaenaceae cyanobacterium bins.39]|nr:DUF6464 family protein [Pseudanabaenaceae cyanobacterium bins.39]
MLDIVVILSVGVAPPILSLWMLHHYQAKYRDRSSHLHHHFYERLDQAIASPTAIKALPPADMTLIEGFGYVIGKVSCKYNARSLYIRCAVNPDGPCQGCRYYESI